MKLPFRLALAAVFSLVPMCVADAAPDYVPLGPANAAVYRPATGTPHIAFIVMHRTANFMRHASCTELAERGYLAICMNPRSVNNESIAEWDNVMLDVKQGVDYARAQPGITKVLLFGHSGGGTVMSSYQATAEKGLAYCAAPGKLAPCSSALAHLPPADGLVLADAHPGDAVMNMRDHDPSVTIAADGSLKVDPALDPYSAANGYDPKGAHYSQDFLKRYSEAQAQRMKALIDQALKQKADIQAGKFYPNEDIILVPTTSATPWLARYDANYYGARETARPEKLLKNDGSVAVQAIVSVGVTTGPATHSFATEPFFLDAFLSSHAVRATNSMDQIDYCSSNDTSICAAGFVSAPVMVAGMGGYVFVHDTERLYDRFASKDKDYVVIEGAVHGFGPCRACAKIPGQYDNSQKNLFDYIKAWTDKRF